MRGFKDNKNNNKKDSTFSSAFTLIELIVVVAVIAILATIAIVGYSSWRQATATAQLKSDLKNASSAMENYRTFNNGYPSSVPSTFISSSGVTLSGGSTDNGSTYCVSAFNSSFPNLTYYLSSSNSGSDAQLGTCITAITAISGTTTAIGNILTAGTITPAGATVSYQWQSATTSGGIYTNIAGANSSTYTIATTNLGKYIKVVATGTGSYSGTVTSAASAVVSDPNWIAGTGVLAGKYVRSADLGSTYQYKTANTAVVSPQGVTGLDSSYPLNMTLVNPQINPGIDFSTYPAQNACKAIGGRLANVQELLAIYSGRATYGNNFLEDFYWSSTEYDTTSAYFVDFYDGTTYHTIYHKLDTIYIRCIEG